MHQSFVTTTGDPRIRCKAITFLLNHSAGIVPVFYHLDPYRTGIFCYVFCAFAEIFKGFLWPHLGHVTSIMSSDFHFLVPKSFHKKIGSDRQSSF